MPPNPKIREETLELENLKFYAENAILAKLWVSTNKKTEKTTIVKALKMDFLIQILLDLTALALNVFFCHLKEQINKDTTISQQIIRIYSDNHECYVYCRITLALSPSTLSIRNSNV